MHFNAYIEDDTGCKLKQVAEQVGETRNALIPYTVSEWLERQELPQWP